MSDLADLYPFLAEAPPDAAPLLAEACRSAQMKAAEIAELRRAMWRRHADDLIAAAHRLARVYRDGGKVLALGNGGSATDARDLVGDLLMPPLPGWRSLPAIDLTRDYAMLTAVGNDVGFDNVFARQIIAHGLPGDAAIGFSTSGESPNVIAAFEQARREGIATIGFVGNRGGRIGEPGIVDHAIIAPSPHNTRIQEAHATASHLLLMMLQQLLREGGA